MRIKPFYNKQKTNEVALQTADPKLFKRTERALRKELLQMRREMVDRDFLLWWQIKLTS